MGLGIEEYLGVVDTVGVSAREVGCCEGFEIRGGDEDGHAYVICRIFFLLVRFMGMMVGKKWWRAARNWSGGRGGGRCSIRR